MAYNNREYLYSYSAVGGTIQVATGRGALHSVVINTGNTGGTIKLIDGTAGTTANMGIITMANSASIVLNYDIIFSAGLRIVVSNSPDITVSYTQT